MSNNEQRDELAEVIRAARKPWATNTEHRRMEAGQADAILAAGYRKPRIITTVDELDALPKGAVILDGEADAYMRTGLHWYATGDPDYFLAKWLTLPATVIHEPTTEATP